MRACLDTYENGYSPSRERFERETATHEMSVLHDDGLYRHLRFMRPDSSMYYFDIVTWPGYLAIVGDCGDYVFARTRDMFEFFADGSGGSRGQINPGYWAEKLQAPRHRDGARSYSIDVFKARVRAWLREQEDELVVELGDLNRPAYDSTLAIGCDWNSRLVWYTGPANALREVGGSDALHQAVNEQLLDPWDYGPHSEEQAHGLLSEFEHDGEGIYDTGEWDLREYDWSFLWCCWAIVRGVEQYRAAAPAVQVAA